MNKVAKIFMPLLFLLTTGAILLLSDLSNRKGLEKKGDDHYIAIIHWLHASFTEGFFTNKSGHFIIAKSRTEKLAT